MAWIGGIFDPGVFDPGVFDTGRFIGRDEDDTIGPSDRGVGKKYGHYKRVMREDDDILEFILNTTTSGILDS